MQYAYRSFAPWRMTPLCSWSLPGRKPGTSTSVTSGMLNASQVCTKRAAFSEAWMSRTPAREAGWLATMPTTWPSRRARPQMMLVAQLACTSKRSPSSTISSITARMSYERLGGSAGTSRDRVSPGAVDRVLAGDGRREFAVVGREEGEQVAYLLQALLLGVVQERAGAGHRGVHLRSAEVVVRDLLAGDGLHDVGARDVHL